jgi:hypothetical protein
MQLTAPDGIGSDAVKRIYADRQGRVWFVTPEAVGYLPSVLAEGTPIPVHIVETAGTGSTTAPVPVGPEVPPLPPTPQITVTILPGPENPSPDSFPGFVDGLLGWLGDLFARDR